MHALIFVILFQIITTFSVVDNMKEQFYSERAKTFRYECLVGYSVVYSSSSFVLFFSPLVHYFWRCISQNPWGWLTWLAYSRKDDPRVKELFDDIEKLRAQFEAVERPILQIETPFPQAETPSDDKLQSASSDDMLQSAPSHPSAEGAVAQKAETVQHPEAGAVKVEKVLNPEDELAKLESEFGNVGHDYSTDEVGEWEFDELERELRSGDSSTTK